MKLSLARDVTLTSVDSGAVLLDGRRGRYFQLNESGSTILRRLLDGQTPDAAAASLSASAPVSEDQARQDVRALVDALSAAHLVEVAQ
ncbi:lasso peptide biosynthesis PqqD family chaperone [Streptomyces sp. ISL-12]|uniref:lasso peptide biosynthesis PqqD family chaperone n=1 Tax=Streptomyces sp. ISL-12 TaxID=2819177 RepID=UPI001BE62C1F|nr:lasso peptide biosynthesis PqqD family chaperone [Streptomyces sp. ISL-12]MBT2410055.1 lasso peptide biosynthesis PqqD family chaperone [Streptomyces sp. ISL-12]